MSGTTARPAGRRRGRVLLASTALAWVVYRAANARWPGRAMPVDSRWWADPNAAADMSRVTPGAAPIHPRPWDIGTGVVGYAWQAPNPRAALLLQHGYAEYALRFVTQYHHLIRHLLTLGISVYAFDAWGHGHSPGRRGLVDVGRAVEDHLAARRLLQAQPLPLFLLGHSLGGLVTASSVVRDQTGLSGVVLSSPALQFDAPRSLLAFARVAGFVAPTAPAPRETAPVSDLYHGAADDKRYTDDPLIYRGRLPMLVAATAGTIAAANWQRYPDWTVPVLAMHGTADTWTDPQGSERLIETVAAADKTLHLVPGGRHELLNDTERDVSLDVLLTWLERRLPPGPAAT